MKNVFEHKTTVTVGDTNVLGNMYFSNYFKLQGAVRELWFHEKVDRGFSCFMNGTIIVTSQADCRYYKDFFLTDRVLVRLQVEALEKASVDLVFRFYSEDTMELHAEGRQKLVFVNRDHKICRIPVPFRTEAAKFMADAGTEARP